MDTQDSMAEWNTPREVLRVTAHGGKVVWRLGLSPEHFYFYLERGVLQ